MDILKFILIAVCLMVSGITIATGGYFMGGAALAFTGGFLHTFWFKEKK